MTNEDSTPLRVFAVGDIHGCDKTFRKLLFDEMRLQKSDEVICLGDYIDRGKDSKAVIDLILELRSKGYNIKTLRGNHEEMMLASQHDENVYYKWLFNGGDTTLASFGIHSVDDLEQDYLNFLKETGYYISTDQYIFVHAGFNFSIPNPFDDKNAMLWIRDFSIDRTKLQGRIIIHGHTPKSFKEIHAQISNGDVASINIDGGCVFNQIEGLGHLFAFEVNQKKLIAVRNIESTVV